MKGIKKISIILICIFILFSLFANTKAASSDLYLNNLHFDVQINSDGSMDITENWNIDIRNTNTLFKTFQKDSTKYSRITDGTVSKVNSTGNEISFFNSNQYAYHVPTGEYYFLNRGSNYEVAWGTGYENSSGTENYKISYHVEDAIAKYNDCSELYWQFIGEDFEIPAKKITGTITLPEQVENKEDIKVWGHTPDLNGTIYATSNNTVEFEINNNKSEKMVEVRIAMPRDLILTTNREYSVDKLNEIIQEETGWANQANSSRIFKIIISVVICLIIFGILIYFAIKNIKVIKNTKPVIPSTHYDYFRDLPRNDATPAEALYISRENYQGFSQYDIGKVFSATLLNLSLKKAIKITEIDNGKDSKIELIPDDITVITNKEDEIAIFNFLKTACKNPVKGLFSNNQQSTNSKEITMKELKKYINYNSQKVVSLKNRLDIAIKKKLTENKILDLEGIKKRAANSKGCSLGFIVSFFAFFFLNNTEIITNTINSIGIPWYLIVIIVLLVIIDLILITKSNKTISVYTTKGVDERDQWIALKKYMMDFSLLKEKDVPDLVLWEKFLVYATAFGISEKVIEQLKIVYPDYDNMDYSIYPNMYILMHMNFASSFNSVSNSMSSAFSSGSGGGGGFSGGGGRRWRPAVAVEEDKSSSFFIGDVP